MKTLGESNAQISEENSSKLVFEQSTWQHSTGNGTQSANQTDKGQSRDLTCYYNKAVLDEVEPEAYENLNQMERNS